MKIVKIEVDNFRLLKNFSIELQKDLSLVIGKNNTGKTSLLSVLDKFINEKSKFLYDDINIDLKNELEGLIKKDGIPDEFEAKGIKLRLFIEYNEYDDLSNVSRVLMDLDPDNNMIVLGFEYTLSYTDFLNLKAEYNSFNANELAKVSQKKKNQPARLSDFLNSELDNYFKIQKKSIECDGTGKITDDKNFIDLKGETISIKNIISYKYISAKRDVTNKEKESTLSKQTSTLYKKKEDNSEKNQATIDFKDQLSETDNILSGIYKDLFKDVIKKVQSFGGIKLNETDIAIISTLEHRNLLEGNTTVVYAHDSQKLPEHYNGLGYMNLISMIFEIEILIQEFKRDNNSKPADINLLIIEEPEAHTHPQMQYVFIKNIKRLLAEGIKRDDGHKRSLQYIITTHSSHIVADSDFDDIKYLKLEAKNDVKAKNLSDLKDKYEVSTNHYQFLKQYLTINRAEVFFADKAILIEGDTERILLPTFMRKIDIEEHTRLTLEGKDDNFLPLLSQNISIIEVGAYSHIFEEFIEFLGIKSLILTDIDSKGEIGNNKLEACPVDQGTETSNTALLHFLPGFLWESLKSLNITQRTKKIGNATVCISYQQREKDYHARSFEDAFIHINLEFVKEKKDNFQSLKNRNRFNAPENNAYILAEKCIEKKTHFALDILYHSNESFSNWNIPSYIKEGLLWLKED